MVTFDVDLVDGEEKELDMWDYVPTKTGMDARAKLEVNLDAEGQTANVSMDNALERADSAKRHLVSEMLDKSGCQVDIDELAFHSFEDIARHYWPQIQGEQAKN